MEATAFDNQIRERVRNGHIPDLRRCGRCEYFYNNVWREQALADLYFGEIVRKVKGIRKKYYNDTEEIDLLEVGCGPGHISLELARNHFNVMGIDLSPACIEIANRYSKEDPWSSDRGRLKYVNGDFLDHRGIYHIILFSASFHHFPDPLQVAKHAKRLMYPNGIIVVDEPVRDCVSSRNSALILLIKGILSSADAFFQNISLPDSEESVRDCMKKIYLEERYVTEEGAKVQSISDNASGFEQIYSVISSCFHEVEFRKEYAFFHQLVGGIRLRSPEKEYELAKFLKLMDSALCQEGAIDPTNFLFVGINNG